MITSAVLLVFALICFICYLTFRKHKMRAIIKTFPCEEGDCIFMKLVDTKSDESYHIMVDCGALSSDITDYICDTLDKRIDLLIATHIDSDHIDGITAMLINEPRLKDIVINKIIYNCYQHFGDDNNTTKLSDKVLAKLALVRSLLGADNGSHISYKTSVSLGAALVSDDTLKNVWNKEAITEKSRYLRLGGKWGKIHFVSPTENALKRLYEKFKQEYASVVGAKIPDHPFENIEDTFEMIIRLEGLRKRVFRGKKIGFDGYLDEQVIDDAKMDDPNEGALDYKNKASLAFVWECNGHKVLFAGDAPSSTIVNNLKKLYGEKLQLYDAVKISHHGSEYNTSTEFCELVDSHVFYLTGGSEKVGHTIECLSKILMREKNDEYHRELRYNVKTRMMDVLASDDMKHIRELYNFGLTNENENEPYEFEY